MFKVIIAGGRDFNDYDLLKKKCDHYLSNKKDVVIVCGMARGADLLGKKYAADINCYVAEFPADWDKYGKSAGYKRNEEMAIYADALIAFWDEKSKGTKHMIDLATKHNLLVRVVNYG